MANIVLNQAAQDGSSTVKVTDAAKGTTFASSQFSVMGFNQCTIIVTTSSVTGTTPTLDIAVQKLMPDGTTWDAIGQFTQITGAASRTMSMKGANYAAGEGGVEAAASTTYTAGKVKAAPFGGVWRLNYVIGGSTPVFTIVTSLEFTC